MKTRLELEDEAIKKLWDVHGWTYSELATCFRKSEKYIQAVLK